MIEPHQNICFHGEKAIFLIVCVIFNDALCIAPELSNICLRKTANGEKTPATAKIMKSTLIKNKYCHA
jgi:hypothetical protein